MRWVGVLVAVAASWPGVVAADRFADILDKPAFTATPAELLEAARLAPAVDTDAVVLRSEHDTSFDDQGRATQRWRVVFAVRTRAGVDGWANVNLNWHPFREDKPVVRVRAIAPDGRVANLDPARATDAPAATKGAAIGDTRTLNAKMSALQVGSVVEQELVLHDREPAPAGGRVVFARVDDDDVPVLSSRIVDSAPVALHAKPRPTGVGVKPAYTTAAGRETWTYTLGRVDPVYREDGTPSDVVTRPGIAIGTGASWKAVASAYRAIVDKRIAEGAVALPPELRHTATLATVRAIGAWLHGKVHATGIEFGDVSDVPATPADTLARGTGDDLDEATFLVALLRKAGVRADVALLAAGAGLDVDRELPAINVFDHAIVRARVAGADVWIDPIEDLVPVGQLPWRDRGRLALVVADDTTDVVTTPAWKPGDNIVRDVRTYELAEVGASRVTEVTRYTGGPEYRQRAWLRDEKPAAIHDSIAHYAARQYGGALERHTTTPVADLATPLDQTIVTTSSGAYANRDSIDIYLYPTATLAQVPETLYDGDAPARRADFAWLEPHVFEIEHRLPIPDGFDLPVPPKDTVQQLGPASLAVKSRVDKRTVIVTMRFDSGKPRITAAEVTALRTAVAELRHKPVHLVAEHVGLTLASRGKYKEAVAEIRRLIALHPKEAVHHSQLAIALTVAGMGEAARREAREAVALEPANAEMYVRLGVVLRRDTLGRIDGPDADRAGARAAFVKARSLDPKLAAAPYELARLLTIGINGVPFGRDSDLPAALEAWRAAYALDKAQGLMLLGALLEAGQAAEAVRVANELPASEARDASLVAATALGSGAAGAVSLVDRMRTGSDRGKLLVLATSLLHASRHYPAARELFKASGAAAPSPLYAKLVDKLVRHGPTAPNDLGTLALEISMIGLDPTYPYPFFDATAERRFREALHAGLPQKVSLANFRDILFAMGEARVTAAAGVWRVESTTIGTTSPTVTYFARVGGTPKLVGLHEVPDELGRYVLGIVGKDDAAAAQLLDWLVADLPGGELARGIAPLWGPKLPRDRDAIAIAAAVLASQGDATAAVPVLAACGGRTGEVRDLCDRGLAVALERLGKWPELEAHTATWQARVATPEAADRAALVRAMALVKLGRGADADRITSEILARKPDDIAAGVTRVHTAAETGAFAEAIRRGDALLAHPTVPLQNDVAWLRLVANVELPKALELAQKAVGPDKSKAPRAVVNTLAAIELELGDLGAAKADAWLTFRPGIDLGPADWYVVGRLAEELGLRDDAIATYRKVAAGSSSDGATSMRTLARRRLDKLGVR